MRRITLLTLLLLLCWINPYAQAIRIHGIIIQSESSLIIPNINIFLKDNRIGTVSDQSGSFSLNLPSSYANGYLYFSGVGYQKDSLLIRDIKSPVTIKLQPETYRLTEVYVMPDSTLLTLLRRAYAKIPDNYPTVPTMYEGFYRESTKNNKKEQADFIEAVLSIYKDPYDKPSSDPGQIEILKSRKKQLRNTNVIYYGGPSHIIRKDAVLSRADFISPRHFKDYSYEFNGIKTLGEDEFYDISFVKIAKDTSRLNGTMLIEKKNLAYASFDIYRQVENTPHLRMKGREQHGKIIYEKMNDIWILKYYTYTHTDILRFTGDTIYGASDYVTTHIKMDSVKPIPYEKQLRVLDPITLKAEEYNPKGWTDYDILKNIEMGKSNFQFSEDESKDIFTQKKSFSTTPAEKFSKIIPFLLRFHFDFGISYRPVSIDNFTHHLSFQPNTSNSSFVINKNQKKESDYVLFQSTLGYRFNKKISVFYQWSDDLLNKSISSNEHHIGIGYQKNIKPKGRPLLVEGSLQFAIKNYYADLGKYDNPSTFHYKGTKIDANKISFDYGIQQKTIIPQIALIRNISRYFSLKLYAGYHFTLHSKNVFRIKEEKGSIFTKKKITLSASDPALTFHDNNMDIWNSFTIHRWQVGVSLVFN